VPADRRSPRWPLRRPPSTRRATDPYAVRRRRIERIWALALRRFRSHLHGTDYLHGADHPDREDDDDRPQ